MSFESRFKKMEQLCEGLISDVNLLMSTLSGKVASLEQEVSRLRKNDETLRNEIKRLEASLKATMEPLNGIITHLTRVYGGNVHDKGIVTVTGSSLFANGAQTRYAVEFGTDTWFASEDKPDSWICYDFKERRVTPTSYSIRTGTDNCPRSWVLEGSNGGGSWEIIDHRDNNFDLKGCLVTHNFQISHPPSKSFSFIRLCQTGKNHDGRDFLALTSFEIFGTLS